MRILAIAVTAIIATSGCSGSVHAPPAGVSYARQSQCTRDQMDCVADCMPNVEWAVIPGLGWVYVPAREYLCQSHCDHAEATCSSGAAADSAR